VLVDFTADWCVTCQVNKKSSLEAPAVRRKLREEGVVALLADYTREDPEITRELRRFGRAGVPLVLVYPREAQKPPLVLPSLLTPGIVLAALEKAR
jgi:thiol:disulfide interchange protein DsbD